MRSFPRHRQLEEVAGAGAEGQARGPADRGQDAGALGQKGEDREAPTHHREVEPGSRGHFAMTRAPSSMGWAKFR